MNNLMLFEKALHFLEEVGIETVYGAIDQENRFLPGFFIDQGKIIIDKKKVKYHGDILHEAAHITVAPPGDRKMLNGKSIAKRTDAAAEEMMAIAWSYAACVHLKIDPHFVFHEEGYQGGGASIVQNFEQGNYFGVPVLQWLGMTSTSTVTNKKMIYPAMIKWLRD